MKARAKVGIYSGSFDPVHLGHITFALQATEEGKLEKVYFLPERTPRGNNVHEHFGHRVAMIKRAIRPHSRLDILELDDRTFDVKKTLPRLQAKFKDKQLVFLFGSDKIPGLIDWPDASKLIESSEVIIGLRQGSSIEQITAETMSWPKPSLKVIVSYWPTIFSTEIRDCLMKGQSADGLLKSVAAYIKQNWLYVSLR